MSKSGNSSRVPLKKVIQSLKDRTVRKYFKKPSLIHLFYVALLQIINSGKQDSFREKIVSRSTKTSQIICNSSERNILLSGDVEESPCPATAETTSPVQEQSSGDPNFALESRMNRYRPTPLDVGGGADYYYFLFCFVFFF